MRKLYFDCSMGAAGDMIMASLFELLNDNEKKEFLEKMNNLGLPGVHIHAEKKVSCGITGTHMDVHVHGHSEHEHQYCHDHGCESHHEHTHEHNHEHNHENNHEHHHEYSNLQSIYNMISTLDLPENVKRDAGAVYRIIAEAEAKVHGGLPENIHFHEVGTLDAVADVTGCCTLIDMLGIDSIIVSPVNVGGGVVHCAHGILPVPAPATALILEGVPIYSGTIQSELCTPTGAALLKYFADEFGPMPQMTIEKTGYGMGTKDFERANIIRVFLEENENCKEKSYENIICHDAGEEVTEVCANIDDMTGEEIGFAMDAIFRAGAKDVYAEPIIMKKSRPAVKLCAICSEDKLDSVIESFLRHTSTIGVRYCRYERKVMERKTVSRSTRWGSVDVKVSTYGDISKSKIEFDSISKIAEENDIALRDIKIDE